MDVISTPAIWNWCPKFKYREGEIIVSLFGVSVGDFPKWTVPINRIIKYEIISKNHSYVEIKGENIIYLIHDDTRKINICALRRKVRKGVINLTRFCKHFQLDFDNTFSMLRSNDEEVRGLMIGIMEAEITKHMYTMSRGKKAIKKILDNV